MDLKQTDDILPVLKKLQLPVIIVGVLGLIVWAMGLGVGGTRETFFQSYLYAYLFWLAIPMGSLAILFLHHTVGGLWGVAIRRMLESAALTIPLMALLFIPIIIAMPDLYEWARPEVVAHDPILQHKAIYLNVPFFIGRAVVYFGLWSVAAWFLVKWSKQQDETADPVILKRFRTLGPPGILIYVLTMTFAAIDWGMSLEPHWFSAIYGGIFFIGQGLTTFAFMIMLVALLSKRKPLSDLLVTKQYHDLGNLLFAFTIIWTYFSLSQFLIMWSGNLPEETPWYIHRSQPGWNEIAVGIVVLQFALPFLLMLQRFMKRNISYLWKVALVIFIMRFADIFWYIMPAFNETVPDVHWMTYAAPIGFGGIWIAIFIEVLKRRPIVPVHDPLVQELASHG
jgi:hypothetical protein